jgi:hypothetical protein
MRATTTAGPEILADVVGRDRRGLLLQSGSERIRVRGAIDLHPGARVRVSFQASPAGPPPSVSRRESDGAADVFRTVLRPDGRLASRLLDLATRVLHADAAGAGPRGESEQRRPHTEGAARAPTTASASERPAAWAAAGLAGRLFDLATGGGGGDDRTRGGAPAAAPNRHRQVVESGTGFRVLDLFLGIAPDLVRLQLHLRRDGGRQRGEGTPAPRRAIVSADFDRLGRCQLDVLCTDRRFDLTVRSARTLPDEVRRSAAVLFLSARDLGGLRGDISFAPGALLDLPQPQDPKDVRSITA